MMQGSGHPDNGWVESFNVGYSLDSINWWLLRNYEDAKRRVLVSIYDNML